MNERLVNEKTIEDMKLSFSFLLNKKLKENDLTQTEFARLSGVSRQTISSYIFGGSLPKYEHLFIFAKILNCTPNDLMHYDEEILQRARSVEAVKKWRKRHL